MKKYYLKCLVVTSVICILYSLIVLAFSSYNNEILYDSALKNYYEYSQTVEVQIKEVIDYDNIDSYEKVLDDIKRTDYGDFIICDKDGFIRYGGNLDLTGGILQGVDDLTLNTILKGEGANFKKEINGSDYLLITSKRSVSEDFLIITLANISLYNDNLDKSNLGLIVALSGGFIVIFASLIVLNKFYKNEIDLSLSTSKSKSYILYTKLDGKFKKANKLFLLEFGKRDITQMFVTNQTLDSAIAQKKAIPLRCINIRGEIKYLIGIVYKQGHKYKVFINEIEEQNGKYLENIDNSKDINADTGLFNIESFYIDINQGIKIPNNECIVAIIKLINLQQLSLLYGFYELSKIKVHYYSYLQSMFNDYGKIYTLREDEAILLIDNTKQAIKFLHNIKDISSSLSKNLNISNKLYEVYSNLGIVRLANMKNISSNAIIQNTKLALKSIDKAVSNYYIIQANNVDYSIKDYTKEGAILNFIASNDLEVHFQPQVDAFTNKVVGFEALIRLNKFHNVGIDIHQLLTIAQMYGGLKELTDFVLIESLKFIKQIDDDKVSVSVNFSPSQIMQRGFIDGVMKRLNEYNVNPSMLNIEITEDSKTIVYDEVINKIKLLRDYGCGIYIDDFGIAYSSMFYLKHLEVTALKIDMEFIYDILDNKKSYNISKNIVNLSRDLNIKCIVEGVETLEQLQMVKSLDAHYIQGWYYSKALACSEAIDFYKTRNKEGKR